MAFDSFVIDASAIVAVVRREPSEGAILGVLAAAGTALIASPTVLEAGMVLMGSTGVRMDIEALVRSLGVRIVPYDQTCVSHALDAFDRFGKGRHPARLNFGDCVVYAIAKTRRLPILCTGDDFAKTDVEVVPLVAP